MSKKSEGDRAARSEKHKKVGSGGQEWSKTYHTDLRARELRQAEKRVLGEG